MTLKVRRSSVAAGVPPAVEPGILPGGAASSNPGNPGGGTPPSTSGETPDAIGSVQSTILRALLFAALALIATGCQNVKPWQRGTLADVSMRADRDPLGGADNNHIFFSREAAEGGESVGGGGCGCN